ncbi:MAG: MotA/TolQ/ExbB proton channel family protein [Pseudomonadota bacterium]
MSLFDQLVAALAGVLDLGGPVVMLLLGLSVVVLTVILYKLWQYSRARVGRHDHLRAALDAWDRGDLALARREARASRSHLAAIATDALDGPSDGRDAARFEAEAEANVARLERGFRILDSIAQVAPLLGLFGTVLGMIDAFRALQAAGAAVDPSVLAGGIWVALLTTAAGLAVAMPTSLVLTFFESRTARERDFADLMLARLRAPRAGRDGAAAAASLDRPAHA